MKKYLEFGKINFMNNLHYFGEFIFKSIFILLILFIFINLWQGIYGAKETIEGFTLPMMIWYLVMTESIFASSSSLVRDIGRDVQSGDIAYQLNKPYNYVFYYAVKAFSYRIIGFFLTFILGALLVFFLVGGFSFNLANAPFIAISVFLALVLDIFALLSIALLSFWFEDANSFRWVYDKIVFTIGGMLIPLEIFPAWLSKISSVLPFSFIAYYPAKVFVSFDFSNFVRTTVIQISYILFFILISLLIYRIGSRRMTINGG